MPAAHRAGMSSFEPLTIDYFENRADGGFRWNVRYDLSFTQNVVEVDLRVRLTGDDPGDLAAIWQDGITSVWNQKVFFADADRLYEVKLDFDFVSSGEHQVVTVHTGSGPCDMSNWYTSYSPGLDDEFAAHEVGHMLGNFDEYAGGATYDGYTRTGTLMSDLTLAGFQDYFSSIEQYTEIYGDLSLSTVLAQVGSAGSDALAGTSGMDGFYGLAGNDTIDGLAGNDYIDAGAGDDVLRGGGGGDDDILIGGGGNDTLNGLGGDDTLCGRGGSDLLAGGGGKDSLAGGAGLDVFAFATAAGASNADRIVDFSAPDDLMRLDNDVFTALATGSLPAEAFRSGPGIVAAADAADRIAYDTTTGNLYYDPDGAGGSAASLFGRLVGAPGISADDFLVTG